MEIRRFRRKRERERESAIDRSNFESHMLLIKGVGWPPSLKRIAGSVTKYYEVVIVKQEGSVVPEIFMRSGTATPAFRLPFQRQRIMVVLQFQLGVNPESPPLPQPMIEISIGLLHRSFRLILANKINHRVPL